MSEISESAKPEAGFSECSALLAVRYAHLRRVVCAANLMKDGTLILGARHWDTMMRRTFALIYRGEKSEWEMERDQGFIDQWGNYLTREEARVIAEKQKQLIERASDGVALYSEDIY